MLDAIGQDWQIGEKIPKNLFPRSYNEKWGINNLYKSDLGPDWRMTYTLLFDAGGIGVVVLDILSHKDYDRLFGYKTT